MQRQGRLASQLPVSTFEWQLACIRIHLSNSHQSYVQTEPPLSWVIYTHCNPGMWSDHRYGTLNSA